MGMGRKGGFRPKLWQWKWDVDRSNNELWIGEVNAGLSCKLKHTEDRWDLFNLRESGIYKDWGNGGKGGCTVEESGRDEVLVRAYTGPRRVKAGEELHFNFGLLITPVKVLDKGHWQWRYSHRSQAAPVAEAAATGTTVINVHQGDALNPYINYPFLRPTSFPPTSREAHARQHEGQNLLHGPRTEQLRGRVLGPAEPGRRNLHAGARLLSARSGRRASAAGRPTGSSWLCEHVVTAMCRLGTSRLGNGRYDAAIATARALALAQLLPGGTQLAGPQRGHRRPVSGWHRLRPRDHESACAR